MSIQDDDMIRRLRHAADTLDEDEDNAPMFGALMRQAALRIVTQASELAARDEQLTRHKAETVHLAISVQHQTAHDAARTFSRESGMTETLQDRLRAAADVYSEHPPIFGLLFEAADELDMLRAVCHPGPPLSEHEDYEPEADLGEFEASVLERMDLELKAETQPECPIHPRDRPVVPEALDASTRAERERVLALAGQMLRDCAGLHGTSMVEIHDALVRRLEALIEDIRCGARTYP